MQSTLRVPHKIECFECPPNRGRAHVVEGEVCLCDTAKRTRRQRRFAAHARLHFGCVCRSNMYEPNARPRERGRCHADGAICHGDTIVWTYIIARTTVVHEYIRRYVRTSVLYSTPGVLRSTLYSNSFDNRFRRRSTTTVDLLYQYGSPSASSRRRDVGRLYTKSVFIVCGFIVSLLIA